MVLVCDSLWPILELVRLEIVPGLTATIIA